MNNYTTDKSNKPNLKKCKDCGSFGMPNRSCKYWINDLMTEWGCKNPKALLKAQEQEKVLKVIFEKNVNIKALKHYLATCDSDVVLKIYNSNVTKDEELTEEEFNLLKMWCEK